MPPEPPPDPATMDELRAFLRAFQIIATQSMLLEDDDAEPDEDRPPLSETVAAWLGVAPGDTPSIGTGLAHVDRPNLQLAIDELMAAEPDGEFHALNPEVVDFMPFSLGALVGGRLQGAFRAAHPSFDDFPVDVDASLKCVRAGVWLTSLNDGRVAIGVAPEGGSGFEGGGMRLEVFAASLEPAQQGLATLLDRMRELNVYRGKVLSFSFDEYGDYGARFMRRPGTTVDELVLPQADLESILGQTVGAGRWAGELRAAGQHLRRGVLLYGPPGTGKTHTIGHLMAAMPDRTVLVLQGSSIGALGQAAALARNLTPSMLVIEDVDLIAKARGMFDDDGTEPLLFQLLNEMDGLAPTDDVLFLLTTNRFEVLEPALTARPGRIDHAVKIDLPDTEARQRLLDLYLRPVEHRIVDAGPVIAHTEGTTASFMKELVRRAVLNSLEAGDGGVVTDPHLASATSDLLTVRGALLDAASLEGGFDPEWDDDWDVDEDDD